MSAAAITGLERLSARMAACTWWHEQHISDHLLIDNDYHLPALNHLLEGYASMLKPCSREWRDSIL
jgi:hypothetical protein